MLFLEVEDVEGYLHKLRSKRFIDNYPSSKISEIIRNNWGEEFFIHDPSGVLWHIGCFYS